MSITPTDLFTTRRPDSPGGKIIQFPLVRIVVALLFLSPAIALHNLLMIFVFEKLEPPWFEICSDMMFPVDLVLMFLLYRLYTRLVEGRPTHEFSFSGAAPEFARGLTVAAALVFGTVLVLFAAGAFHVQGMNSPWRLLQALVLFSSGAFIQVLIFRLILFRLSEELLGTWLAFGLTAVLFGLAHMVNENITPAAFAGLVVGDVVLFAAFALTRRLWLVWGFHAGWNFCQDGVLGLPNSGLTTLPSWLVSSTSGPAWFTGGTFGIEASLLAGLLTLPVGLWLIRLVVKRKQTVQPAWRRRRVSGP